MISNKEENNSIELSHKSIGNLEQNEPSLFINSNHTN